MRRSSSSSTSKPAAGGQAAGQQPDQPQQPGVGRDGQFDRAVDGIHDAVVSTTRGGWVRPGRSGEPDPRPGSPGDGGPVRGPALLRVPLRCAPWPDHGGGHGHGTRAIIAAFFANLGIAIAKFIGYVITGSASMLAEGDWRNWAPPSC